ncbi:MAG TPA: hypothetical protein VK190_03740 [Pseudoneobacillus sp.]|nr:hypothetical protein [Pseudoneobacillus sp.]
MDWVEVRHRFPNSCVLVEALKAETIENRRNLTDISVISVHEDGNAAWKDYKKLHLEDRTRELYILHTNNEEIKIIEQPYIGVRRR